MNRAARNEVGREDGFHSLYAIGGYRDSAFARARNHFVAVVGLASCSRPQDAECSRAWARPT
jgi:hypothetical protein